MSDRLRVGLMLPLFSGDWDKVVSAAREAEELGFDGVFAFDHLFRMGGRPDQPSIDVFATLAGVAAATSRIAVGTLVCRAGLRPAGMVAKMAATIQEISGGRMVLGMGAGDDGNAPEHRVYGFEGVPAADRHEHLAETVCALVALFGGEVWSGGRLVGPIAGPLLPPPDPPVPVWVGGVSDRMVGIAARSASAWNGWGLGPERFAAKVAVLRREADGRAVEATWAGIAVVGKDRHEAAELLGARERDGRPVDVGGSPEEVAATLRSFHANGATWAVLLPAGPPGRRRIIAEQVLPALG